MGWIIKNCFVRKNKTIAAGFKSSNVIEILEKNYKTFWQLKVIIMIL